MKKLLLLFMLFPWGLYAQEYKQYSEITIGIIVKLPEET